MGCRTLYPMHPCCLCLMGAQVTSSALRLLDESGLTLRSEWRPPAGSAISMACSDDECVLLVAGGRHLCLMSVADGMWVETSSVLMEHEVACVAIRKPPASQRASSAMETDEVTEAQSLPPMCAAGLWTDLSVRLLSLPSLELLHTEQLGGEASHRLPMPSHFPPIWPFCTHHHQPST